MTDLDRARIYDALTHPNVHGRLDLDGDTIAAICDVLTDEQPHERGHTAPHGPHSPSGAPEGPAIRDRGADGRTAVRVIPVQCDEPTPPLCFCGASTFLSRPIHNAGCLWRLNPEPLRKIAAEALTRYAEAQPDTGPDSQDSRQDTPDTTPGHGPPASADTTRTSQDTGLRCVCGDPIEPWTGPGAPGWIHSPGSDTRCLDARPAAVLAVRDREMEQLRTELAAARRELATSETARAHLRAEREQLRDLLRAEKNRADKAIQREETAEEHANELGNALAMQEGVSADLRVESTARNDKLDRVRAECDAIEAETYADASEDANGQGAAVRRIRAALDGPAAEQPAPTTYAEAQQRHIQILHRRRAAIAAVTTAWERLELDAVRDLVRLSPTNATKER
ncbi:hypothetical protein ACFV1F_17005 [Streptomyces sp. NPDC059590]|uniref:hypothetical protein n=1 Tax=Streptomyces sp. NPDC059590 TaxID=3346877 RepID=UPI00368CC85D